MAYIRAANTPGQILPVQITLDGVQVRIEWIEPADGAQAISAYEIQILTFDQQTFDKTVTCDGSLSHIVENNFCEIPMQEFTSAPFNLPQGRLI